MCDFVWMNTETARINNLSVFDHNVTSIFKKNYTDKPNEIYYFLA